jgi:hypothetical protein
MKTDGPGGVELCHPCSERDLSRFVSLISAWCFGSMEFYDFPYMIGMSSSQLTNSYFSEGWLNHQPLIFHFLVFFHFLVVVQYRERRAEVPFWACRAQDMRVPPFQQPR